MKSILKNRGSFTLIELLVTLAIVAILSVVVIMTLNPSELLKQARDSNRLSDLSTLNTALAAYSADVTGGFMGTSSIVYVSIPDTTSTCANLGLPTLPSGWSYNCVTSTSTKLSNGLGWIPVNFSNISFGSPLSSLPVDPINTTSSGNYYTYVSGGSFILTAIPESERQKTALSSNPNISNYPGVIAMGNNLSLSPLYNPSGLVGYWNFDEGSGTVAKDGSGNGNDGTLTNSPTRIINGDGMRSGAMTFNDALYQGVITPSSTITKPASAVSLALWIRAGATSGTYDVVAAETNYNTLTQGYGMYFSANRLYFYTVTHNGSIPNVSYADTANWHYVVGTYDGGVMNLYLDGALASSYARTGAMEYLNSAGFMMGASYTAQTIYYYNGSMDDVRIYNRALSAAEVSALYNATI